MSGSISLALMDRHIRVLLTALQVSVFLTIGDVTAIRTPQEGKLHFTLDLQSLKRVKRNTEVFNWTIQMTSSQISDVVKMHNKLRRLEPAANMEFMTWNNYLADMAQQKAEECQWRHSFPYRNAKTIPYQKLGQNLYFVAGIDRLNHSHAVKRWWDEIESYLPESNSCSAGTCLHYTQVIWAASREVGCGYHKCGTLFGSGRNYSDAHYFVCHYGPPGNVQGSRPIERGPACSKCESGRPWCDVTPPRGLCRRDCSQQGQQPHCKCAAMCQNGGAVSCDCGCNCPDGWGGADCTLECKNTRSQCGSGYPRWYCDDDTYGATIRKWCPVTCELCRPAPENGTAVLPVGCNSNTLAVSSSFASTSTAVPLTTTDASFTTVTSAATTKAELAPITTRDMPLITPTKANMSSLITTLKRTIRPQTIAVTSSPVTNGTSAETSPLAPSAIEQFFSNSTNIAIVAFSANAVLVIIAIILIVLIRRRAVQKRAVAKLLGNSVTYVTEKSHHRAKLYLYEISGNGTGPLDTLSIDNKNYNEEENVTVPNDSEAPTSMHDSANDSHLSNGNVQNGHVLTKENKS